ncbi:uncharacterized protein LKV04_013008 [Tautogolabrus adspersus]
MVALWCPHYKGSNDAKVIWTSHTTQELDLSSNMSAAELRRVGVLVDGRTLVILSASAKHQGNYSCSQGNASSQFVLTVYTSPSKEYEEWNTYSATCFTQESCTLHCPDVNIPDVNTPNMTSNGIMWHKRGESLPKDSYFSSVTENDHGVYTCTRSYLYHQLIYNMTFTILLAVRPNIISGQSVILSPHMDEVFHVALDSTVVIECTAVIYSNFDEVFWLSDTSFVERNNNLPVFYNNTRESNAEGMNMTASLVFKKVTKEDLRKSYTCKLETDDQPSSFVRITLAQKASPFSVPLALGTTGIIMMIVFVTAVVYVKFKMDIALFLRDTLCCTCSISDGKSHDAFLMYYKSLAGLNDMDRERLESVLEERFGYNLCSYDQNVSPGKDAVLYCIEQSQTVVLVPTSSDPGLEPGLLKDILASLVERQNHLVFIKFKSEQVSRSGSVPEALQLLSVFPCGTNDIGVKSGEMVALWCPNHKGSNDAELIWTRETLLINNMSSDEQRQMGLLVYGRKLMILSASVNHQGNYSCYQRNASSEFMLTVYTSQSKEYENRTKYSETCFTQESCMLHCPDVNIPDEKTPNMTSNDIMWHKFNYTVAGYFSSVEENDHGDYMCTRSYLYDQQTYNMTFTVILDVKPYKKIQTSTIISPQKDDVFHVDLGSTAVISCRAVVLSDSDSLFWLSGDSMLKKNESLTVFYNETRENINDEIHINASLVIKSVTIEDLSKHYTCKLDSDDKPSFVIITLAQKARPSYISMAVGSVCIIVVMLLTTAVYVKFKIHITLFLRDTLGCLRSTSDGQSYDAFLMCYKSDTDGLSEDDRELLKSVLEEGFDYNLCLYDRDILPGKAVAEAVLDCIEQSQAVVLVPTSLDPGLGSGLLSVIHSALVEKKTRLVFIKTESTEVSKSGSVPEALQLLSEAGNCVTWKGKRSLTPSSFFWKQLRYHLPAPQHVPKIRLLTQTV